MATNRFDTIIVKNVLKKDFTFHYDSEPFTIPAGKSVNWPRELAEHAIEKLIDRCILVRETWKHPRKTFAGQPVVVNGGPVLNDPKLREKYRSMITVKVNQGTPEDGKPQTQGELMKQQIAEIESQEDNFGDLGDLENADGASSDDNETFPANDQEAEVKQEVNGLDWDQIKEQAEQFGINYVGRKKADIKADLVQAKLAEE